MAIEDELDHQISDYIENTFIDRKKATVYQAFEVLYAYQYENPEEAYVELLADDSVIDSFTLQDTFITILNSQIDEVLAEHRLTLIDNVTLYVKTEIATALFDLMYLVDYSHVMTIMETDESNEIKLAKILSESCLLTTLEILETIVEMDPIILTKLYELAKAKEDDNIVTIDEANTEILYNIKLYNTIHKDTIGYKLLESGVSTNNPISNYIALIGDDLDFNEYRDMDQLAIEIFSLLLISRSNLNGLLLLYNKYSSLLLDNINTITTIEPKLIALLQEFLDIKKNNEVTR